MKFLSSLDAPYRYVNSTGIDDLTAMRDIPAAALLPESETESSPALMDGVYVPLERLENFVQAVGVLARKHHVSLPLYGRALDGVFYTRPTVQLRRIADKQKIFKLIDQYFQLVIAHGGYAIAEEGEGRLKSPFVYRELDAEVKELYGKIRSVFDPYSTMNPGVKQDVTIKELVAHLRTSYDVSPRSIGE